MRPLILFPFILVGASNGFPSVINKISVKKSDQGLTTTTEDPDAYNGYDPFDLTDTSYFSDLTNNSKRIKLELQTTQFIQKFGAQELLNIILKKVQNVQLPHESKGAINDFLDFVEDLIYNTAAARIEKKLKYDLNNSKAFKKSKKLHIGEAEAAVQKQILEYGDEKDHRRRDAPALSQSAVLIDENENYPAVRQPLEPAKLAFLTHNEPSFLREESVIRRSPSKLKKRRKLSRAQFENAIKMAEREAREAEMEEILKKRKVQLARIAKRRKEKREEMKRRRASKKLPIEKIEENNVRRSPVSKRVTFNEKMFQLLEDYGISSFRVETADYTVRAFADPAKTRFSSINFLDVPEYNTAIRRKQSRPPFVYSRTIQAPGRELPLRSKSAAAKRKRGLNLERLL
uniref:Uncharacterized protein n=2 Tax=Caenorhabditis japonica TaxID=281687 RepID=A0A8R1DWN6_CAEJA